MTIRQNYWTLIRMGVNGTIFHEECPTARGLFSDRFLGGSELYRNRSDTEIQRELMQVMQNKEAALSDRQAAELCLRCFISDQTYYNTIELAQRFGDPGGFNADEVFPLVLDDVDSSIPLTIEPLSPYRPFASRVLETFDGDRSSLSTWAKRLFRQYKELNAFLEERGIVIQTPWAILNDATPKRIERFAIDRLSPSQIQRACVLVDVYHLVYRGDRLANPHKGRKCADPTLEQLQRMLAALESRGIQDYSPEKIRSELLELAELFRPPKVESLSCPQNQLLMEGHSASGLEVDEADRVFTKYTQSFLRCLDQAIEETIFARFNPDCSTGRVAQLSQQQKLLEKRTAFLRMMGLFYVEGRSAQQIANQIGVNQSTVSRLLRLQDLRADIKDRMLILVREQNAEMASTYASMPMLSRLSQRLESALDQLVQQDEKEVFSPVSSRQSLLATRICHYLQTKGSTHEMLA
jgi:hypothetical protein